MAEEFLYFIPVRPSLHIIPWQLAIVRKVLMKQGKIWVSTRLESDNGETLTFPPEKFFGYQPAD